MFFIKFITFKYFLKNDNFAFNKIKNKYFFNKINLLKNNKKLKSNLDQDQPEQATLESISFNFIKIYI